MQQAFIPVQLNERISIMDSLRGIAILGIFIANLGTGFSFYDAALKIEGFYQSIAYTLGVAPVALAYVSLFFLFAQTAIGRNVTAVLQPVVKMAFTNYITHSIIGTLVFYGAGLGLAREVGPVYYTLLALLVFIGQLILSKIWLKYFNYGPVEWLWRSATYKNWQQFTKKPNI